MDHQHYMNHRHWTEGTTGGCSDRGMSDAGSFSAGYLLCREEDPWGSLVSDGHYGDTGADGPSYVALSHISVGNHSHTINDHTHTWGAWSGGSCHLDTNTSRDYVDSAVKFNGSQYVDRSLTDGAVVLNGVQYVDRSYTDYNGNVLDQESRPKNVTIRIWVRTR